MNINSTHLSVGHWGIFLCPSLSFFSLWGYVTYVWPRSKLSNNFFERSTFSYQFQFKLIRINETLLHAVTLEYLCDTLYQWNEYLQTIRFCGSPQQTKAIICAPSHILNIVSPPLFPCLAIWSVPIKSPGQTKKNHKNRRDSFSIKFIYTKYDRAKCLYSLYYSCACYAATWNDVSAYLKSPLNSTRTH